jgi:hypothetical protein
VGSGCGFGIRFKFLRFLFFSFLLCVGVPVEQGRGNGLDGLETFDIFLDLTHSIKILAHGNIFKIDSRIPSSTSLNLHIYKPHE